MKRRYPLEHIMRIFVISITAAFFLLIPPPRLSAADAALRYTLAAQNNRRHTGSLISPRTMHPQFYSGQQQIAYCGYLGGTGNDIAYTMAIDSQGCVYVGGTVYEDSSSYFWKIPREAFVAKIRTDGRGLVYHVTIGSKLSITGIAVDASGRASITGTVWSGSDLTVTGGPDLVFNGGDCDAFVARLSPTGTSLDYAGYIGGVNRDYGQAIALDGDGNAYVGGTTFSSQSTFPVIVGPILTMDSTPGEGFVAKVRFNGAGLDYCGYISGWHTEVNGIAVDNQGCAYICGGATGGVPEVVGPDLTYNGEDCDAYVAKLKADGSGFVYSGWIGGRDGDFEWANAIAIDNQGCAYVTGYTECSETGGFPVHNGPDLTANGGYDTFVAKVKADGTALVYCGFIGGQADDGGNAIAIDDAGNAYVCGYTASTESSFPVVNGPDLTANNGYDAFIARVKADGSGLDICSFIGGDGEDEARGIAVDSSGSIYVAGLTQSTEATFPVKTGPNLIFNREAGNVNDAFVAKLAITFQITFNPGSGGTLSGETNQQVITGGSTGPVTAVPDADHIFSNWTGSNNFFSTANPLTITGVTSDMTITAKFPVFQLTLQGVRRESRAWLSRRPYAALNITIANPTEITVSRYVLQRKDGTGDYVSIQEISGASLSGNVRSFLDQTLPASGTSTYRIEARDGSGNVLAASNEVAL